MTDGVCTFCGCVCDDIAIDVVDGRVIRAGNACRLGEAGLFAPPVTSSVPAWIDGRPADLGAATRRAADILSAARYPFLYGLTHTTCEAQRAAVALADRLGAVIDSLALPAGPLFPDIGTVSCSLGEIKNRADLLVIWNCNPAVTHPRLTTRYAIDPPGLFVPGGRPGRTVVVVGDRSAADDLKADAFVPLPAGQDFTALWRLRALARGQPTDTSGEWRTLAERMKAARFGVLILDGRIGGRVNEAAHGLATDLNDMTRFYVLTLRGAGNGVGLQQVLTWQTGYAATVGLHADAPRSYPGEFRLDRGEADAALVVGADEPAADHLSRIPHITLSPRAHASAPAAAVAITTAAFPGSAAGTTFRLDGLTLTLRPAISPSAPDDFQVLRLIERSLPDARR